MQEVMKLLRQQGEREIVFTNCRTQHHHSTEEVQMTFFTTTNTCFAVSVSLMVYQSSLTYCTILGESVSLAEFMINTGEMLYVLGLCCS